ncbi:hypothetical protein L249_5699 [Ophiocordyceps polyrhachis-furcata BCC 54312]|uniref:Uncharacterized protein n=1 Tax=Ophiocordyceps polyrhachis-furcata BCC 54312 TaxID=1330021 RepID=A0A367KZX3_9HYPO|nr:hypothetical protein L249_5699 [Ophiocordyceps polyrhachis-furcata BCC 54312]
MAQKQGSHPLLEQVPLTVSPFVSLPTATTLSYNYKTMPSNIPPSALGIPTAADEEQQQQQPPAPRFVVSGSGHVASPQEILESCEALLKHVRQLQASAERELRDFEASIRERDLAEKRRLAPGWLDSDERLLKPEPSVSAQKQIQKVEASEPDPGAELDRAFGGMDLS